MFCRDANIEFEIVFLQIGQGVFMSAVIINHSNGVLYCYKSNAYRVKHQIGNPRFILKNTIIYHVGLLSAYKDNKT